MISHWASLNLASAPLVSTRPTMKTFLWLTILIIIAATIVANLGLGVVLFKFVELLPGKDVTAHFLLYFLLGFAVSLYLRMAKNVSIRTNAIWIAIIAILVTAEEFSQALIPSRSFSYKDLIASLGGLLAGTLVANLICWIRSKRR